MAVFGDAGAASRGFCARGRGGCAAEGDAAGDAAVAVDDADGAGAGAAAADADAAGAAALPGVGEGAVGAPADTGVAAAVAAGAFVPCAHTGEIGSGPAKAASPISGAKRK